jgi:inhibitor of cysteine peptidase
MLIVSQVENGRTFSVSVSEQFEVALPENPTTGHRWFLSMNEKSSGCVLMDDVFEPSSNEPGAGGAHRWKFQAAELGKCSLEFLNRRSWGEAQADAPKFSVTIETQS